jgi:hypothetical protein
MSAIAGLENGWVRAEPALRAAAREAGGGLGDFGDDAWLEGFRRLLDAYDRESHLTDMGRAMVWGELTNVLRNRILVERAVAECPVIRSHEIRRPIFILGLPRTGTTALHHLLAQDPGNQTLEFWLASAPKPRPPRSEWERHPHFQEALKTLEWMYTTDPSLKAIHLMTADGPEECRHLLQQTFMDDTFECNATIPSYSAWYRRKDATGAYARHRDVLRVIGSTTPERRWVLKYPSHLRHLRELFAVYPDACIVQTHRDPSRVLASLSSLIAGWRALYEGESDRKAIGRWQLGLWTNTMANALAFRKKSDPKRFFDLDFREIVFDAVGAARRAYEHFGLDFTAEGERRLRSWRDANPQHKQGEHRYDAADFDLAPDRVRDAFRPYFEHFGITAEK